LDAGLRIRPTWSALAALSRQEWLSRRDS